jgi:hypothetical protein
MPHISALAAMHVFLAVLLIGTFWRLASAHLIASPNQNLANLGRGMSFQY